MTPTFPQINYMIKLNYIKKALRNYDMHPKS